MPLPPPSGRTLQFYAQELDAKYPGRGVGTAFLDFAAAHPALSPQQDASAFALEIGIKGLAAAVSDAVAGTGQAVGQIATGSEKGAGNVAKALSWTDALGNFLNFITGRTGWIRIGEAVIGVALIIVGVDHLTSSTSAVGKAAHTVAKGALLA
jgi:hypothetical protein